jgi:hypothetical protein
LEIFKTFLPNDYKASAEMERDIKVGAWMNIQEDGTWPK